MSECLDGLEPLDDSVTQNKWDNCQWDGASFSTPSGHIVEDETWHGQTAMEISRSPGMRPGTPLSDPAVDCPALNLNGDFDFDCSIEVLLERSQSVEDFNRSPSARSSII